MFSITLISALAVASSAFATPLVPRAACSSYLIIDTRGTFEAQGPSVGFVTMNQNVQSAVPGGSEYDTVYPAAATQDSSAATTDIVNHINSGLASNPAQCFILEGYSQGAAATVNALPKLTGAAFDAVKAVVLLGNPYHKAGLACNVDENGGTTTANVNGISAYQGVSIPSNWVSKSLDICWKGDGICDSQNGGFNTQHLNYGSSSAVQTAGADFIKKGLQG